MHPLAATQQVALPFFEDCIEVFKRVFTPFKVIHRGFVSINSMHTGYVGLDKAKKFSTHLSQMNSETIPMERQDCYVTVLVTLQPQKSLNPFLQKVESVLRFLFGFIPRPELPQPRQELPSSLFKNAVEDGKILYRHDTIPMELTLCQKYDPAPLAETFQEALHEVINESRRLNRYLYASDIPQDELTFIGTIVDKKASFFDANLRSLSLDQTALSDFAKKIMGAETMKITHSSFDDGKQRVRCDLAGIQKNDILFLIDGTKLYILAYRQEPDDCYFTKRMEFDDTINPQSMHITLENGLMDINFQWNKA